MIYKFMSVLKVSDKLSFNQLNKLFKNRLNSLGFREGNVSRRFLEGMGYIKEGGYPVEVSVYLDNKVYEICASEYGEYKALFSASWFEDILSNVERIDVMLKYYAQNDSDDNVVYLNFDELDEIFRDELAELGFTSLSSGANSRRFLAACGELYKDSDGDWYLPDAPEVLNIEIEKAYFANLLKKDGISL